METPKQTTKFHQLEIDDKFTIGNWTYQKTDWNKAAVLVRPADVAVNKVCPDIGGEKFFGPTSSVIYVP